MSGQDAHESRGARTMQADADIVLNTAADQSQEASWLPPPLRDCDLELDAGERTLRWIRGDDQQGCLTAHPRGAGTCEIEMITHRDLAGVNSLHVALRALEITVAEKLTAG
ncbi:hypothetical protein [Lentzea sp. NPDC003310]|uniref:hypothetical protein n=1 Tax=Lentzea sp. NPDC003310 TaxID=3154447 RepID=UPI0033A6A355